MKADDGSPSSATASSCPSSLTAALGDTSVLKALDSNAEADASSSSSPSAVDAPRQVPIPLAAPRGVRGIFRGGDAYGDYEPMDLECLAPATVLLNVYDVGEEELVKKINRWGTMHDKILLGGVFHVGVQVYGHEYGYGQVEDPGITGVCDCPPRSNWQHTYKCTVDLGPTEMSESEVSVHLHEMARSPKWEGFIYDLLHHNCLHFASALCNGLHVRRMPAWLDRFGRAAVVIQGVTEQATDNWSRAKMVASKTAADFRTVKDQVRSSEIGSSISQWGSGLFAAATRALGGDSQEVQQNRRQSEPHDLGNEARREERSQNRTHSEPHDGFHPPLESSVSAGPVVYSMETEGEAKQQVDAKGTDSSPLDDWLLDDSKASVEVQSPPKQSEETQRW